MLHAILDESELEQCLTAPSGQDIGAAFRQGEVMILADRVEVVEADLLDLNGFDALPAAPNVLFMVGRKFGSKQYLPLTWATYNSVGRSL